jgi:tetratricopeptide (TPR) repeat protein
MILLRRKDAIMRCVALPLALALCAIGALVPPAWADDACDGEKIPITTSSEEAAAKYQQSVETIRSSDLPREIKSNAELNSIYSAGAVALKKGDLREARIKARQYLKGAEKARNPNQIRLAHQLAGMIELEKGDYDTALKELAKASQQDPYNLYRLALGYNGAGDRAKAREFCEAAATFNSPSNLSHAFVRNKARRLLESL